MLAPRNSATTRGSSALSDGTAVQLAVRLALSKADWTRAEEVEP